jgi:hypothetical protein
MYRYINENGITTPFKAEFLVMNLPSDFLKKMQKFEKTTVDSSMSKNTSDPFIISEYFEIYTEVTNNIPPKQLWNLHETCFCLHPIRTRVLGQTGAASHRATNGCL